MIHPIPSGTRDVLPDETREVRAITDILRGVFERHGYGEVYTPALEYESVLARADMAEARPAYRVFDETGAVLVLRSDMTVPIARLVGSRYQAAEPPLRVFFGDAGLPMIKCEYAERIATWEKWNDVSLEAQGNLAPR